MTLPPDLIDMLSAFAGADLRYLVVGGHAVSLHARPRTTKDLDVWLEPERDNIENACAALTHFGVPGHLVQTLRDAHASEIVWIGRAPTRVDFLQTLPGLSFPEAWERRVTVDIQGTPIYFLGCEDLLINKRKVGRAQDLRDVKAIEKAMARAKGRKRS